MYYEHIPKKKGLLYRGMQNAEFVNAKRNGYFKSSNPQGTFFTEDPRHAEDRAEFIAKPGTISLPGKPTYVIAIAKKDFKVISSKDFDSIVRTRKLKGLPTNLNWMMAFKERTSGDDELIKSKIPFKKVKEVYEFSIENRRWIRII